MIELTVAELSSCRQKKETGYNDFSFSREFIGYNRFIAFDQ
ncbi:hypothetical protein ACQCT6_16015 [Cytobacillus gottheilii]